MPVALKYSLKILPNATGQAPPSNNEETITVDMMKVAYPSIQDKNQCKGIIVFKPIIDWLEIGCSVKPKHEKEIAEIFTSDGMLAKEDFFSFGPFDQKPKVHKAKSKGYKRSIYWINGGKLARQVLINYVPIGKKDFIKIVLQPSRLTTADMKAFQDFWDSTFINHPYLKLDQIYARPKAIKRLDVAVDMLNVSVTSIVPRFVIEPKAKKKKSIVAYCDMTGRKETVYLLKVADEPARDKIYNKRQEILDNGGKYSFGALPMTRWERTVKTELPVNGLAMIKNHAADLDFQAFDFRALKGKSHSHGLFVNYALVRSAQKAAEPLPPAAATKYTHFFTSNLIAFWRPEAIWNSWPSELKRLNLCT